MNMFTGKSNAEVLVEVIRTLEGWANQSIQGGWSTHQVEPQRNLANELKVFLMDNQINR